jgi:hypothetical protein
MDLYTVLPEEQECPSTAAQMSWAVIPSLVTVIDILTDIRSWHIENKNQN